LRCAIEKYNNENTNVNNVICGYLFIFEHVILSHEFASITFMQIIWKFQTSTNMQ